MYIVLKEGCVIMATSNITISLDSSLKNEAIAMFEDMGLDIESATKLFYRQVVRQGKIPFEISSDIPNAETIEAIKEVQQMKKHPDDYKEYNDVDLMMKELLT